jgi:hypothetical protein
MVMTWTARALTEEEHEAVLANPGRAAELVEDEPPDPKRGVDLDTAWHGIHWLLTGTAYDAETATGQAIFGGEPIGPDLGNGKAHLIDAPTVRKISAALDNLTAAELGERIDVDAMQAADIYPGFWHERDVFHDWLQPRYKALRKFYRRAAKQGRPVLTAIL